MDYTSLNKMLGSLEIKETKNSTFSKIVNNQNNFTRDMILTNNGNINNGFNPHIVNPQRDFNSNNNKFKENDNNQKIENYNFVPKIKFQSMKDT